MKEIHEDELRFVARHYKANRLNSGQAWQTLQQRVGRAARLTRRRLAIAASLVLAVGIALAGGLWGYFRSAASPSSAPVPAGAVSPTASPEGDSVVVFRFENEPVGHVLRRISAHYGRSLTASDTTRCVSGEVEAGPLPEVVAILERTLGIQITVR